MSGAVSGADVTVLVAAGLAAVAAGAAVVVVVVLTRRITQLEALLDELRRETVPLVRDARVVVDQAATEMVRVGDVLGSAEAVSSTVDSASRLAYRAFTNPVVRVLAFSTGARGALRRLFGRSVPAYQAPPKPVTWDVPSTGAPTPSSATRRHRRTKVRQ
jgi:hypothetical protein